MATKKIGYAKYRLSPLAKITTEAKKLRKANPNMKWSDAVKKASSAYNNGKHKLAGIKKTVKKAAVKKIAVKKKTVKKVAVKKTSGNNDSIQRYISLSNYINHYQKNLLDFQLGCKKYPGETLAQKREDKKKIEQYKKIIAAGKKQLAIQKTLI